MHTSYQVNITIFYLVYQNRVLTLLIIIIFVSGAGHNPNSNNIFCIHYSSGINFSVSNKKVFGLMAFVFTEDALQLDKHTGSCII